MRGAAAAKAQEVGSRDAGHGFDASRVLRREPLGRRVDQRVDACAAPADSRPPAMKSATPTAASASACGIAVIASRRARPARSTEEDEIAGKMQRVGRERVAAGLRARRARRARQRTRSTTSESDDRREGEEVGVDLAPSRPSRCSAATATPTASTSRKPVCASAATASILAWPNGWSSSAGLSASRTAK